VGISAWSTFGSGDILPASQMNTDLRDNGRWLSHHATGGAPMCRVYRANVMLTPSAQTAVDFDAESFDLGDMHSTSSNTSRITIPFGGDGIYLIGANSSWPGATFGDTPVYQVIVKNGVTRLAQTANTGGALASASYDVDLTTTTLAELAAGDYIHLALGHQVIASSAVSVGENILFFWAKWVGETP
jgi:hypothetical protein